MHGPDLVQHLEPACTEVLETMFFTSVLEVGTGGEPAATPAVSSCLAFHGSTSGFFRVATSEEAAHSLAAAFLGEDEHDLPTEKRGEVICEMANMLCGSFLSRFGGESVFDLSHPELGSDPLEHADAMARFQLPEGEIVVSVRLEGPV
jgi:CheY-specific phosphatase CheX